jgi:hypothetical protein
VCSDRRSGGNESGAQATPGFKRPEKKKPKKWRLSRLKCLVSLVETIPWRNPLSEGKSSQVSTVKGRQANNVFLLG